MSEAKALADRLEELYIGLHITEAAHLLRQLESENEALKKQNNYLINLPLMNNIREQQK